jgi:signal transduction histidine kinase
MLARRNGQIRLAVDDDGTGIAKSAARAGMGLRNMQTRARLIGARWEIRRRRNRGTLVTCELPAKSDRKA